MCLGDKNTKFFHNFASSRKKQNMIHGLINDMGVGMVADRDREEIAINYFQNLFLSQGDGNMNYLLSGVKQCISIDMNRMLMAKYSGEELLAALKGMGPTKALGIYGFPALFY